MSDWNESNNWIVRTLGLRTADILGLRHIGLRNLWTSANLGRNSDQNSRLGPASLPTWITITLVRQRQTSKWPLSIPDSDVTPMPDVQFFSLLITWLGQSQKNFFRLGRGAVFADDVMQRNGGRAVDQSWVLWNWSRTWELLIGRI